MIVVVCLLVVWKRRRSIRKRSILYLLYVPLNSKLIIHVYLHSKNMTSDQLINSSLSTQKETDDALKRIHAAALDAKEIGTATGAELLRQTDQMNKIGEDLDEIDGELDRSNKVSVDNSMFSFVVDRNS